MLDNSNHANDFLFSLWSLAKMVWFKTIDKKPATFLTSIIPLFSRKQMQTTINSQAPNSVQYFEWEKYKSLDLK